MVNGICYVQERIAQHTHEKLCNRKQDDELGDLVAMVIERIKREIYTKDM